jgi:hypothetical protein
MALFFIEVSTGVESCILMPGNLSKTVFWVNLCPDAGLGCPVRPEDDRYVIPELTKSGL